MQGLAGAGGREGQREQRVPAVRPPRGERRVIHRAAHFVQVGLASCDVSEIGVTVAAERSEEPV